MHTLVIGAGFSGACIVQSALKSGSVAATRRSGSSLAELMALGAEVFTFDGGLSQALLESLSRATHLVVSVPPSREQALPDSALLALSSLSLDMLPNLQWIGYLSTIGVYGDHGGAWIDETTACGSTQERSRLRLEAEMHWQQFASKRGLPLSVLRLSGIYGPGRNALVNAMQNSARMLIKPGQVFNRIHVYDLAQATLLAARARHDGVLNITDDLPAPPQEVIRYAHDLLGKSYPQAQQFDTADISAMARSFYSENKRVSNRLSKSVLGLTYSYPTYRHGLDALYKKHYQPTTTNHV